LFDIIDGMNKEPSLYHPQMEFVQHFLQPDQLQRMLIYFSKQKPTDSNSQHGFSDVIVRLINDPLTIIFGEHGVYLFSNFLLVYPYNELDSTQITYIANFLRMHVADLPDIDTTGSEKLGVCAGPFPTSCVHSTNIDVRVTKQMGGGFTVRPIQLSNIRLDTLNVMFALVRGIMCGSQKHDLKYRQHAVNLQLQRILTRIVVSRAQLQCINSEIEKCMQKQSPLQASGEVGGTNVGSSGVDSMVECV
jgi:hypothetical protein